MIKYYCLKNILVTFKIMNKTNSEIKLFTIGIILVYEWFIFNYDFKTC